MTTTRLVVPGEGSVANANTTVASNEAYTADSFDKEIFLEPGATLTLAPTPAPGKTVLVVAVGADASVAGGAHPISGGDLFLSANTMVTFVFDTTNKWIPSTSVAFPAPSEGQEPAWFLDGQNVTGNASDLNNGTTPATPLRTHAALEKRLNGVTILPPVVLVPVPFPPFAIPLRPWTVFVMSNLPITDPVGLQCTFGPDVIPQYIGLAAATISSGTFTAVNPTAVALRRATSSAMTVTDSARAGLPWEPHQRIRTASGKISFVAENLLPDQCATLEFSIPAPYPFPSVSMTAPLVGETYFVESLTELALKSDFLTRFSGTSGRPPTLPVSTSFIQPVIGFKDIHVVNSDNAWVILDTTLMQFTSCRINPMITYLNSACTFKSTAFLNGGNFIGGSHTILGGGAFETGGAGFVVTSTIEMILGGAGLYRVDADAMCYGGPSWHLNTSGVLLGGFLATFKATAKGTHAAAGFGMSNPPGATFSGGNAIGFGGSRFWGSGNAKKGAYIYPGATMHWGDHAVPSQLVPTCTGALGEFSSGLTSDNDSTAINPASDPPVYELKQTNVWSQLAVAVGLGGFGGTAINATSGSRVASATRDV